MDIKNKDLLSRKKNYSNGFSLAELLLASAIFSIIILTLYSSFWSGLKISKRATEGSKIYRDVQMGLGMMAKEISNMVSYNCLNSYENKEVFSGASDEISFLLPTKKGLKIISYYLKPEEETFIHKTMMGGRFKKNVSVKETTYSDVPHKVLVRTEKTLEDFLEQAEDRSPAEEIVCSGIKEDGFKISYAYLDISSDVSSLSWKESWDKEYLPAGIKVFITFVDKRRKRRALTFEKNIYAPIGFWGEG